jgi:hypothetical protein
MLYDPSFYFTATGDGNVQVNYNTIAAVSSVSCGIENSGGTIGLQYLYNGVYDSHAMPLQNAFAIKYTTGTGIAPSVQITLEPQGTPIVIPPGGGTFNYNLTVTNTGNTTAYFSGWTEATLPDSSLYGPILLRTGLALSPGGAMFRAMTQTVPATAPAGDYTYWGRLGSYPGFVLSEDSFPFSKSGVDASGLKTYSDWTITGWEGEGLAVLTNIPTEFFLSQNYPNPFNPVTTINYSLPADLTVDLSVYNILGQKILTLVEGKESAGYHSITWDASNLPSGIYFYHLNAGEYSQIRKCVLMK